MPKSDDPNYHPNELLDEVIRAQNLKNDAALARFFQVAPPVISKIRHYRLPVGDSMIIKCIELAGMPIASIRSYIGGNP